MKIAIFYPSDRDKLFCDESEFDFSLQKCDETCDLIYVTSISKLDEALNAKKKFKIPLVCWCWDIPYNWRDWNMSSQGIKDNTFRDSVNLNRANQLKECDLVITASKWVQEVIKEKYNIDSTQMYQYIDTKGLDSVPDGNKKNTIIQISRFFYNKKFHESVIATKDINYTLNLYGTNINSNYGNEIKSVIDKYNKNVNIFNNPSRIDVIKGIKESKLLVSPSVFEGWGITPIEALYCGTPILLSDLPVFKEVYGDNILYHERNNPNDMNKKIKLLLNDSDLQLDIIKKGQEIISDFTVVKFAKRWDSLINEKFKIKK